MEDEDSNEPMSLADRLKQKGSPIDVMRGGAQAKEKKPKAQKGTVNFALSNHTYFWLFKQLVAYRCMKVVKKAHA